MKPHPWKVAVVGAGNVGLVLGRTLVDQGDQITAVVSRTQGSVRKGARFLHCSNAGTSLDEIPASTELILITTPHGAVAEVAAGLAKLRHLDVHRLTVCHASGMFTAKVLAPLAERGATTFSFHPLQTFPRDFDPRDILPTIPGIWYGVDGAPNGLRAARQLARRLGGRAVEIPPAMRAYYHAACVVASNHLTAVLGVLETMHRSMDISGVDFFSLFKPIIMTTLANVEAASPAEALSGPVARGGVETIEKHFEALRTISPDLVPYFAAMTRETSTLALVKGSIGQEQATAMRDLVESYVQTPATVETNH